MYYADIFNIQKFSLHDGPGIRTAVFFKGCSLRCRWCANPEAFLAQSGPLAGQTVTLAEVLTEVLKDKPFYDTSGGGVTLTGGEPMLQPEFVAALCGALHAEGVHVAVETAAAVPADVFRRVLDGCDFALIDLKHWDAEKHEQGTGAGNAQIIENLRFALTQRPVIVRIPVIPGFNHSADDANGFAALLPALGAREVHLLPFHQLGESKYTQLNAAYPYAGAAQLHADDLAEFAGILQAVGLRVQLGG